MGLTYRDIKGSELTFDELDNNFRHFTGSHSITGSLIVSGSSPTSITLGDGSVFQVSNPSGSMLFSGTASYSGSFTTSGSTSMTGSFNLTGSADFGGPVTVSGSITISGSGGVITSNQTSSFITGSTGAFAGTGSNVFSGSQTITGSLTLTGSLTVSGSDTFRNDGPFLQTGNSIFSGNITSSGAISSSGVITMATASIGGGIFTSASLAAGGGGGFTPSLSTDVPARNITSSANISSSGNIEGPSFSVPSNGTYQIGNSGSGTYIGGTATTMQAYVQSTQKMTIGTNLNLLNFEDINVNNGNIIGARIISGSTISTHGSLTAATASVTSYIQAREIKSLNDISIQNTLAENSPINITSSGNIDINSLMGGIRIRNFGEAAPIHITSSGNAVIKSLNGNVDIQSAAGNITLTPQPEGSLNLNSGILGGDINMTSQFGKLKGNFVNTHISSSTEFYLRKTVTEEGKNNQIKGNDSGLFIDGMDNSSIYITGSQTIRIQKTGTNEAGDFIKSIIEFDTAGNLTIQSGATIKISGSNDVRFTDLPSIQPSVSGGLWVSGSGGGTASGSGYLMAYGY
tara:strand:- start:81 stop:1799 length:1719 start_codon:yes stop_codon:yes gene_type:complete